MRKWCFYIRDQSPPIIVNLDAKLGYDLMMIFNLRLGIKM
jgi:hypothetical protein